jgi:hypothetical protein
VPDAASVSAPPVTSAVICWVALPPPGVPGTSGSSGSSGVVAADDAEAVTGSSEVPPA